MSHLGFPEGSTISPHPFPIGIDYGTVDCSLSPVPSQRQVSTYIVSRVQSEVGEKSSGDIGTTRTVPTKALGFLLPVDLHLPVSES